MRWGSSVVLAWMLGLVLGAAPARAQVTNQAPELDERASVEEHLGERLPTNAVFRDQEGHTVQLGDLLDGRRPVVLTFAYHSCPMLCDRVLEGVIDALKQTEWTVGEQFDFINVSIDPRDTPERAAAKRARLIERYGRGDGKGFHFLTGENAEIQRVAAGAGFRYFWEERTQQYAHSAAMIVMTPDGRMARYLYGIVFSPEDVRFGLLEASEGRSITTVEQLLMFCYRYDPQGRRYAIVATRVMQVGGALVAAALGLALAFLWARELKNSRRQKAASSAQSSRARLPGETSSGARLPGEPSAAADLNQVSRT